MAADVTLLALPNTEANRETARRCTYDLLFADDEELRDEDGTVIDVSGGQQRTVFNREFYARPDLHHCPVGPVSWLKAGFLGADTYLPAPTVAVAEIWDKPKILTTGLMKATLVALNLPDRSHYRRWRDCQLP